MRGYPLLLLLISSQPISELHSNHIRMDILIPAEPGAWRCRKPVITQLSSGRARWRTRPSLTLEFVLHVQADEFSLPLQRQEKYVNLCITAADKPLWEASEKAYLCETQLITAFSELTSGDPESLASMPASPEHQAFSRLRPKGVRVKHLGSVCPLRLCVCEDSCVCRCVEYRDEDCYNHPCLRAEVPAHSRDRMLCKEIRDLKWKDDKQWGKKSLEFQ